MSAARRWAGASAGSITFHAGVLALFVAALRPEPVPTQSRPQMSMDVIAASVRTQEAAALPVKGTATRTSDHGSLRLADATIPATSGRPVDPPSYVIAARAPDAEPAAELSRPPPLAAASTIDAVTLAPSHAAPNAVVFLRPPPAVTANGRTAGSKVAPETLPIRIMAPAEAPAQQVVVAARPSAARLAAEAPRSPPAAVVEVPARLSDPQAVPSTPAAAIRVVPASSPPPAIAPSADARPLDLANMPLVASKVAGERPVVTVPVGPERSESAPPAKAVTAALAWTGDTASIELKSLAAIGAFLTPSTDESSVEVRDRVSSTLSGVDCARLQTVFDPASGALELRGHVPADNLRNQVVSSLVSEIGGAIPIVDRLRVLPRPQCGLLALLDEVGLPQSDEQALDPRIIGPDTQVRDYAFSDGDPLVLDVVSPSYPSTVYVDYYDASGAVLHLQPNDMIAPELVPPDTELTVGSRRSESPSLALTVGPPYGEEIAVAFAVSYPLYDGVRPTVEPAERYLSFLRDRVAATRARHHDLKGEWVYFFVTTRAR
jgi:hypothetical protein